MRDILSNVLYSMMEKDKNIFLIVGDVGYPFLNTIRRAFPDRFINVGAAEQSMFDVAVGLSLSDKYPICYTITPFILRGFETLRTYVDYEKLPMLIVGSGRNKEYLRDGISHWAIGTDRFFNLFENLKYLEPKKEDLDLVLRDIIDNKKSCIITLEK
jgi:transketolase